MILPGACVRAGTLPFGPTDSRCCCLPVLPLPALVALPPGGYDGTTCISDFRSVILPAADPPMNSFPAAAAAAAGHSFGGMQSQPRNLFADGLGLLNSPNVADTVLQAYSAAD